MPFFENASRFIINGDKEPPPNTQQILSHAVEVVQQAVATGNTSGAYFWGVRPMSAEEQNILQEELARSDRQLDSMNKRREAVKIASYGESQTFKFNGEHCGLQRPHQGILSPPAGILSQNMIMEKESPITLIPRPSEIERPPSSIRKSRRRLDTLKRLLGRLRREPIK